MSLTVQKSTGSVLKRRDILRFFSESEIETQDVAYLLSTSFYEKGN